MAPDNDFEQAIQALLDGRPLLPPDGAFGNGASLIEPLRVMEAITRANRLAIFGTDVPLDRPVSTRWGHLEVRGEIGRGASGTVYRAWDTQLTREVALKLLTSDADPREALEEGRLLARLNHPHIVRVYGADSHDGMAGIWMELLEGETLDEILARDGVFGAEETLLIGLDLARALTAVHSAGLLHRDVKARNVVRERGGRVVLMDFGAGRTADKPPEGGDETGTPMYMAPEVLRGGPATVRSDIYCLGVLLYRLLTRAFPVTATDLEQLRSAHGAGSRVPLGAVREDLPSEIVTTIDRGCHPDPDARYASAADFEAALAEALQCTLSQRTSVASPMTRWAARWRKTALVGAATIAVALLTTWGAWDTPLARATRRGLGLPVAPQSPLYLTMNGGLGIVRGGRLTVFPYNPATASSIAVSSDLGVQTMAGIPPWTTGGSFRLDGSPVSAPSIVNEGLCCFYDGTTDGDFNYAPRADSTLLEPMGSRPLAPAALYRFERDWSNPQPYFLLEQGGVYYLGVAYSARSHSFWLARQVRDGSVIEQWSRDGKRLSTPVNLAAASLSGIAVDPRDGTLWVVRNAGGVMRLENFDGSGRHLASLGVQRAPFNFLPIVASGAEFEWIRGR